MLFDTKRSWVPRDLLTGKRSPTGVRLHISRTQAVLALVNQKLSSDGRCSTVENNEACRVDVRKGMRAAQCLRRARRPDQSVVLFPNFGCQPLTRNSRYAAFGVGSSQLGLMAAAPKPCRFREVTALYQR